MGDSSAKTHNRQVKHRTVVPQKHGSIRSRSTPFFSRRSFLAWSAVLPLSLRAFATRQLPVGLELYSVRKALQQDLMGTVRAVAHMGYECVEFYAPYFDWTEPQAKSVRKLLDDLNVRCFSTHNSSSVFTPEGLKHARDLNLVLGSKYVVMASSQPDQGLDGWKKAAETLNSAAEQLEPAGLTVGYHNHRLEFIPIEGTRPMEVLAKNTKPSIILQLDIGTCLEAGSDPVAWIRSNPGRIRSMHCKDWSPDPGKGYSVLFGEGVADWASIFSAAETVGGIEYYLVEQEGSRLSEFDTAKECLRRFRAQHAG
jgi:sugar phosphate isomerase/epimerase